MEQGLTPRAAAAALRQLDTLDRRMRRDRPSPSLPLVIVPLVAAAGFALNRACSRGR